MTIYRGFSTADFTNIGVLNNSFHSAEVSSNVNIGTYQKTLRYVAHNSSLTLTDVQLVEQNLINHIFTSKGSRVRQCTFGTRIPKILFEPLDERTITIIEEDLKSVFAYDPRVELQLLQVLPNYDRNMVKVVASLYYIELKMSKDFNLNLEFKG